MAKRAFMIRGTVRSRVSTVLVAGLALYLAVWELAAEFVIRPPQSIYGVWYGVGPILVGAGAAVVVGVVVKRRAILALALLPVAVQVTLDASGYVRPWHEIAPAINPGWPIAAVVALALGLGLLTTPRQDVTQQQRQGSSVPIKPS